jgi:hypothetical protein
MSETAPQGPPGEIVHLVQSITAEPPNSSSVAPLIEQLQRSLVMVEGLSEAAAAAAAAAESDLADLQEFRRGLASKVAEFEGRIERRIRAVNRFNAEVSMLASQARRLVVAVNLTVPQSLPIPTAVTALVKKRPELEHILRRAARPIDVTALKPLCGIYFLLSDGETVYVGQSVNVVGRIGQHVADASKTFDACCCFGCERHELDDLERALISLLRPRLNVRGKPLLPDQSTELFGAQALVQGVQK